MKHNGQNFLVIFMVLILLIVASGYVFEDGVDDPYPGPEVTVTVPNPYPAPATATPKPKKGDTVPTLFETIERTDVYRPTSAPTEKPYD